MCDVVPARGARMGERLTLAKNRGAGRRSGDAFVLPAVTAAACHDPLQLDRSAAGGRAGGAWRFARCAGPSASRAWSRLVHASYLHTHCAATPEVVVAPGAGGCAAGGACMTARCLVVCGSAPCDSGAKPDAVKGCPVKRARGRSRFVPATAATRVVPGARLDGRRRHVDAERPCDSTSSMTDSLAGGMRSGTAAGAAIALPVFVDVGTAPSRTLVDPGALLYRSPTSCRKPPRPRA